MDTWRSEGTVGGEDVGAHAPGADGDLDAAVVITTEGDPVSYISRRIVAVHGGLNLKTWVSLRTQLNVLNMGWENVGALRCTFGRLICGVEKHGSSIFIGRKAEAGLIQRYVSHVMN